MLSHCSTSLQHRNRQLMKRRALKKIDEEKTRLKRSVEIWMEKRAPGRLQKNETVIVLNDIKRASTLVDLSKRTLSAFKQTVTRSQRLVDEITGTKPLIFKPTVMKENLEAESTCMPKNNANLTSRHNRTDLMEMVKPLIEVVRSREPYNPILTPSNNSQPCMRRCNRGKIQSPPNCSQDKSKEAQLVSKIKSLEDKFRRMQVDIQRKEKMIQDLNRKKKLSSTLKTNGHSEPESKLDLINKAEKVLNQQLASLENVRDCVIPLYVPNVIGRPSK
ncbi:hypothetical protein ACOME3_006993 [Neoechinorhynchus agilis]